MKIKFPIFKLIANINYAEMLRHSTFNNFLVKLMALATAIVLYVYVGLENKVEKSIRVPLILENQPKGYAISGSLPPRYLTVQLYGSRGEMAKINEDKILASINLNKFNLKKTSRRLTYYPRIEYQFPRSVKIDRIIPDKIEIEFSKRTKKILPIEPTFINQPKDENIIIVHTIKPKKINVYGPENIVEDTVNIYTEPIDLKGLAENTEFEVKISKSTSSLLEFDFDKEEKNFRVVVKIANKYIVKEMENSIVVNIIELNGGIKVDESSILTLDMVSANIDAEAVSNFNESEDLYFYASASNIETPGIYELSIDYELPDYIKEINFSPEKLTLKIVQEIEAK